MSGVEFLRVVKERWPAIQRVLLTGQADSSAIEEAVNQAEIFRFIWKPWDDSHLLATIQSAVDQYWIVEENHRLQRLVADAERRAGAAEPRPRRAARAALGRARPGREGVARQLRRHRRSAGHPPRRRVRGGPLQHRLRARRRRRADGHRRACGAPSTPTARCRARPAARWRSPARPSARWSSATGPGCCAASPSRTRRAAGARLQGRHRGARGRAPALPRREDVGGRPARRRRRPRDQQPAGRDPRLRPDDGARAEPERRGQGEPAAHPGRGAAGEADRRVAAPLLPPAEGGGAGAGRPPGRLRGRALPAAAAAEGSEVRGRPRAGSRRWRSATPTSSSRSS